MATTYNVSFNLANETTGASNNPYVLSNNTGQYPQIYLQSNGTYGVSRVNVSPFLNPATNGTTDAPTIYIKQGDTINVIPNNPGQTSGSTVFQALSAADSEPDPSSPTQWPVPSGTTHTLQYPTSGVDYETTWFYFGLPTTTVSGTTQYTRSARVKIYVVKVGSLSLSNTTIAGTGGTMTVTANSVAGLKTTVGNTNNLYLHVRNVSTNQIMFSNVSFSGASNPFLGKITTSTTSRTLTISSSLPAGTYSVNIGHFGGNGQGSGATANPFYGSDNIITSAQFTKTAADTQPDPFSFTNPSARQPGAEFTAPSFTVSGINAPASISVSGAGSPQYSLGGGSFTTSSGTVTNGQTVQLKMFASGSYDGQVTGTLNIGGETASLTLTTISDPGTGSGAASTNADYGLQVFNASGNEVFGPNQKVTNLISQGVVTINSGASQVLPSGGGTFEGVTSTNQADIDLIILPASAIGSDSLDLARGNGSNGASEGQFKITNTGSSNQSITFYVVRIG